MNEQVAIIGMSGKFPGAKNIDEFWNLLKTGKSGLSEFSTIELSQLGISEEQLNDPSYVKVRGIIDDEEYFDSNFFGFNNTEAALMDPQARIFLECTWSALEDAGYGAVNQRPSVALYASASRSEYEHFLIRNLDDTELASPFALDGTFSDFIALRTSYKLNLQGPSIMVGTACSSSLVTVHLACQNLLNKESEIAVAGAVSISWPPRAGRLASPGSIFSATGECRPFDESANGIVSGDAVACVVLKLLNQALLDGDHIYAVIRGSAINNDGANKISFSAPSVDGQVKVIKSALKSANLTPKDIGYIEAHGTGTLLGDPIEIQALAEAFANTDDNLQKIAIGAVKASVGHSDAAAGLVGLVKTTLCLHHQMLVPSVGFKTANPYLEINDTPFYICNKAEPWKDRQIASIQSLGMGGTNAHILLERAPPVNSTASRNKMYLPQLIPLSAKTLTSLQSYRASLIEYFIRNPECDLKDVAWTLQIGREEFPYRLAVIATDSKDAIYQLLREQTFSERTNPLPTINGEIEPLFSEFTEPNPELPTLFSTETKDNLFLDRLELLKYRWIHNIPINWYVLPRGGSVKRVNLPTYPFERTKHIVTRKKSRINTQKNSKLAKQDRGGNEPDQKKAHIITELRNVWYKTLGLDVLSNRDDFFTIGGDSVSAIQLLFYLREIFGINISVSQLEKNPSIELMATCLLDILSEKLT